MFNIGDKIVYPMHGAGIIEEIEEKNILGEVREYYIMKIPFGDMKVMIPLDNIDEIGVRGVISPEEFPRVLNVLGQCISSMPDNWNRRYRENMEKLKTGNIYDVAEVVRNLMVADRQKGLSTGERKMLSNAKQILISEIILVKDIDHEAANEIIHQSVFKDELSDK